MDSARMERPPREWANNARQSGAVVLLARLRRSWTAVTGLLIIVVVVCTAIFAGVLAPGNPAEMEPMLRSLSPDAQHWMGTDHLGRDVYTRVVHGSRVAMYVALLTIAIGLGAGIPFGLAAGYFGGVFDLILSRLMDLMMSFPVVVLAMVITVILGSGVTTVGLAVGIVYIPAFARLVRASTLILKESEFVLAARALGYNHQRILFLHILPNCMAPIIVSGSVIMAYALIMEATLSFLGLGTQPPTPSWGFDLKMNLIYVELNPAATVFPGLAILITVLGFNMLGDGLRDSLDPRLRQ